MNPTTTLAWVVAAMEQRSDYTMGGQNNMNSASWNLNKMDANYEVACITVLYCGYNVIIGKFS